MSDHPTKLDEIMAALGPQPSPAVASLRWSGFTAWDVAPELQVPNWPLPEKYRALIQPTSTWAALASRREVEKNPHVIMPMKEAWNFVELADGGVLFFDPAKPLNEETR